MAAFNKASSKKAAPADPQQSLFDSMFAMAVNSKREPIFPEFEKRLSIDPMDALLLLDRPLPERMQSNFL